MTDQQTAAAITRAFRETFTPAPVRIRTTTVTGTCYQVDIPAAAAGHAGLLGSFADLSRAEASLRRHCPIWVGIGAVAALKRRAGAAPAVRIMITTAV